MDLRSVVVIKDSDDVTIVSPDSPGQNSTIVLSDTEDDTTLMDSKDKIPFLDLDPTPSPPKKIRKDESPKFQMKSTIQKAPDTEDGEIISSPELDAADIEITLHAEVSSSDESLEEKAEESSPNVQEEEKEEEKEDKEEPESKPEKKEVNRVVVKETKTKEDFPQKEQPVVRKRVAQLLADDDEIEMDHLEIFAPQQDLKKAKAKIKESSKSNSPNKAKDSPKGKYGSPEKDHKKLSPREDYNRKRPYDSSEELRRHSDNETEDKKGRAEKKSGGGESEDLRKHLLKKLGNVKERGAAVKSRETQERPKERERVRERYKEGGRDRDRDKSSKDKYDRKRTDDAQEKHISKDKAKGNSSDPNSEYKSKTDSSTSSSKKDKKDKSKRHEEKDRSKKKKKRKHKEVVEEEEEPKDPTPTQDEIVLEKSPEIIIKDQEQSYDDISSPEIEDSPQQNIADSRSPGSTSNRSSDASPPMSISRSPSRSPTPERSPTPIRKRTYFPAIEGCRNVEEFSWLNRIEEGTYGVVYRARDKRTDEIVALKRLKMEKEREGFPITSLREINTLLKAQHPNIVTVREIVVGSNMDKIYIVMDYVEHDLKALMETMTNPFLVGEVKTLMLQLLRGVCHMHDNWILHRDIKASNLLLSHKGILKIGDFGLAREYGSPLKRYTSVVVTLWYRAPELLLGQKEYSTPIDLWSCGCVFAELLTMKPLFPGKSEIDQINRIFKELGTPNDRIWPGPPAYSELPQVKKMNIVQHPYNNLRSRFGANFTNEGFNLLNSLLTYDPKKRISASEALDHPYFRESPRPVDPSMFPTWPAKSELGHRATKKNASPKPPEGGQFNAQMGEGEGGGFHMSTTTKGTSAKGQGFNLKF